MDNTVFGKRWYMHDIARGYSFNRRELTELLDLLSRCGYNGFGFYMEGCFEFPSLKGVTRSGCATPDDAMWLRREAKKRGMELIPFTNLAAHAVDFLSQERFHDMGKNGDEYEFDLFNPALLDFAKGVLDDIIDCFQPLYLHIGGDELNISDAERPAFFAFLSALCAHVRARDVAPCVWGDMILGHMQLHERYNQCVPCTWGDEVRNGVIPASEFDEEVIVFDWWYYGYRPETIDLLKKAGYENIVICPGTQSWNGFVATQFLCPWRDELPWDFSRTLESDQIEAFWQDGLKYGISDGMLCDWEHYKGHSLWAGVLTIARGGIFLSGRSTDDEILEHTLFGRVTPCTQIVRLLQNAGRKILQQAEKFPGRLVTHGRLMDAVYLPNYMNKLLKCSDLINAAIVDEMQAAAESSKKLLEGWDCEGSTEDRVYRNLLFAAEYVIAAAQIVKTANLKSEYHKAALMQYTNYAAFCDSIRKVAAQFKVLYDCYPRLLEVQTAAIYDSGHTREDIVMLRANADRVLNILRILEEYINGKSVIAIASWDNILDKALGGVNIYQ